jgi:hypothetical protein
MVLNNGFIQPVIFIVMSTIQNLLIKFRKLSIFMINTQGELVSESSVSVKVVPLGSPSCKYFYKPLQQSDLL